MARFSVLLSFALCASLLFALVHAEGRVLVDFIDPINNDRLTFADPVHVKDARVQNVNTESLRLINQYNLNAQVSTISFSSTSSENGFGVHADLGASLRSASDLTVTSGKTFSFSGNTADFDSIDKTSLSAATGNLTLQSGTELSIRGRDNTITGTTNGVSVASEGDIEFTGANGFEMESQSITSFSYLGAAQLSSSKGDVDVAAGTTLTIKSPTTIDIDGHKVLSLSSNGLTNLNATRNLALAGEHFFAQSLGATSITSSGHIDVFAARDLFVQGNSVNAVGQNGLQVLVDNPKAVVGFTGVANLVTNAGASPVAFIIKASGVGGQVQLSSAAETDIVSNKFTTTASLDLNIGSSGTPQIDLEAATLLTFAATTIISDSVKTFALDSANTLAIQATNDRIVYSSPSVGLTTTTKDLNLQAVDLVDITSEFSDPILLTSAQDMNFVAQDDLKIAADAALRSTSTTTQTTTAKTVTMVSGGGHDISFSGDLTAATTQLFAKQDLTLKSNRFEAVFQTLDVDAKDVKISSTANVDGQRVKAANVVLQATTTFTSTTSNGDLLIRGIADNAAVNVLGKQLVVDSQNDRVLMAAGDATFNAKTGTMTFTANTAKQGIITFSGTTGATIDGKTGLTVTNAMGTSSMLSSNIFWTGDQASTIKYQGNSFGDVQRQLSFVSAGIVSIGANNDKPTSVVSDKHIDVNVAVNAVIQAPQGSGTMTADELLRIKADLGELLVQTKGGDLQFIITDDTILVEAHGAYRSTSRDETQFKAGSDIRLNSHDKLTSVSDGTGEILGGEIYVASGELKDISVTAQTHVTFTALTDDKQSINVDGRRFQVDGTTSTEIRGGNVEMNAVDVTVNAQTSNFQAANGLSAVNTDSILVNATDVFNLNGPLVHIKSGLDHNVTVQSKREISVKSVANIITSSEGNVTYFAINDILVNTDAADISFTGISNVYTQSSRRTSLLANDPNSDDAFKIAAGGSFYAKSDNGTDARIISNQAISIKSSGRQHYLGLGEDVNKCGIHHRVSGNFMAKAVLGELYLAGKRCVNLTSFDSAQNMNGHIQFTATREVFIHGEDGPVVIQADGHDGTQAMLINTNKDAGNIEIAATEAFVKLSAQKAALIQATKDVHLSGDGGVDVRSTLPNGDVAFHAGAKIIIDGARGVNISAGAEVPASKGALTISSAKLLRMQADSDIEFRSLGPVQGGVGLTLKATNGEMLFTTQNGYDVDITASRDVSFVAQSGDFIIRTNGGDLEFDSDAGKTSMVGSTFTASSTDGPVHISAGGFGGSVTVKSTAEQIEAKSTGDMRMTSNGRTIMNVANVNTDVQLKFLSQNGDVTMSTKRISDDIVFIAQHVVNLANQDDRVTPEDLIAIRGNNVEYDGTTTTATDPGIELLTDDVLWVGKNSNPVFLINAGIDAANKDVGFKVVSSTGALKFSTDAGFNIFGNDEVSFAGSLELEMNGEEDFIFTSAGNAAAADVSFSSKTGITLQGHGAQLDSVSDFSALSKETLTIENTGIEEGDILELVTRTPTVPILLNAKEPAVGILTTRGDTFKVTQDTPLITFIASKRQLHIRSVGNTDDDDQDPANIELETKANLLIKSVESTTFTTEEAHADIVFRTQGATSNIDLNLESGDKPVTFLSTRGIVDVDSFDFSATATVKAVKLTTTADPIFPELSNMRLEADGLITFTSVTEKIDIASKTITIETTQNDAPLTLNAGTGTGNLLIDSTTSDIKLTVVPYSLGNMEFKGKGFDISNLDATAQGIFIDSDKDVSIFTNAESNIKSTNAEVSITSGTAETPATLLQLSAKATDPVLFQTQDQDADIIVTGIQAEFTAGVGNVAVPMQITGTERVHFESGTQLILDSTAPDTKAFDILAPQGSIGINTKDVVVQAQTSIDFLASGYDALKQHGILIEQFKDIQATLAVTASAQDRIDISSVVNPGAILIKGNADVSGAALHMLANGESGRVIIESRTQIVATGATIPIQAGNSANFISGNTLSLTYAASLDVKTKGKQSGILVETTPAATNGRITSTSAASITLTSDNINLESSAPGTKGGDVFLKSNGAFDVVIKNGDVNSYDAIISADAGDVLFKTAETVAVTAATINFDSGVLFKPTMANLQILPGAALLQRAEYIHMGTNGANGAIYTIGGDVSLTTNGRREESDDIRLFATTDLSIDSTGEVSLTTLPDDGNIFFTSGNLGTSTLTSGTGPVVINSDGGQRYLFQDTTDAPDRNLGLKIQAVANDVAFKTSGEDTQVQFLSDQLLLVTATGAVKQHDRNTKVGFFEVEPQHWRQVQPFPYSTCAEVYGGYSNCGNAPNRPDPSSAARAAEYRLFGDDIESLYQSVLKFGFLADPAAPAEIIFA